PIFRLRLRSFVVGATRAGRAVARVRTRARLAVALFPFAFVAVLLALWASAEAATPELIDPDYHVRLRVVRAAQHQHPDRPLGLMIGSSRAVWAFRPEQLGDGEGVLWVNGAHTGAGPTLNRLLVHRYLRDGVRPAVLVIELMPTFFVKENTQFVTGHFALADLSLVRGYSDKPFGYEYRLLLHRVRCAPALARGDDPLARSDALHPRGGHTTVYGDVTPAERARRTALAQKENEPHLRHMTVRPAADRAFRDTLREAADHGARVVLLRAPEGPTFRHWYDPAGLARFDAYIEGVAREYGAPVLDARLWLDEEDFHDSHHAIQRGADKFTARFAREMVAILAR
ncbi:MAG: hypothetical protein ACKODX_18580, partial [Gemmata sp.]